MPNLLATASQVANSLSNLKAKYIKYLEGLCSANGIDIAKLKTDGELHSTLEMYFGGLPVLVGLKYFTNLSTLRLFGQQITCLKPLAEIAPTLEELWVCEGPVKDLAGVEHCVRLKKLYLYDNSIEDPTHLSALNLLQVLDLSSNKIRSLTFLKSLKDLTTLSLANNKMRDQILAGTIWPSNIQHLDLSNNSFSSYKTIFSLTVLCSLRFLNVDWDPRIDCAVFFTWIAHSFRFLEFLNDDRIADSFVGVYRPMIDTILGERFARCAKIDEKHFKDLRIVEKHAIKIEHRLGCLVDALQILRDSMQSKEVKKEIVKRVHEICQNNGKMVKNVKKNFTLLSEFLRTLAKFRIASELESSYTFMIRDGSSEEHSLTSQMLNFGCSMKHSYQIEVKSCSMLIQDQLTKSDAERLFILEKDCHETIFSIRSIISLLDRYSRKDYIRTNIRLVRDFEIVRKQGAEKTNIFFLPVVISKMGKTRILDEDGIATGSSADTIGWGDVRLVAVLAVEVQPIGQIAIDQIRYMDKFEESWHVQLQKLNEMNIKLDIKNDKHYNRKLEDHQAEPTIESIDNQQSKVRKVSDVISNPQLLLNRIADDDAIPIEWFSTRNPLELALAYFDPKIYREIGDMTMRLTCLDLSEQKLTKLAGVQELVSLQMLSVRKNRLVSVKKLLRLPMLRYLDASANFVSRIEQLPSTLIHVELASNRLQSVGFCASLPVIRKLNLSQNQIKSLKGIELCGQLENLKIFENHINEKMDIEFLKSLPKLAHLDISGNPISSQDGYRSKITNVSPYLISLDRLIIPAEERHINTSKQTTRGLSLELLERICPEWKSKKELMVRDQKIEQIIFEKGQIDELSHVQLIDLSRNKLTSVKEICPLSISTLILSNNSIKCVAVCEGGVQAFKNLENLNLSANAINNSSLIRLGLQILQKLKNIDLSYNCITKLDCAIFDSPSVESIDLSNNAIKIITRKPLRSLTNLNLNNNRLATLSPLYCPNLRSLDVSNNKLASCASLKPLCECKSLETLDCRNNSVTERRVYVDFIRSQVSSVRRLDNEQVSSEVEITKRKLSRAQDLSVTNRRNSTVTTSMLSWLEKEEEETLNPMPIVSSFVDQHSFAARPRRLEPIRDRKAEENMGFLLIGTKAIQHRKI